MTWIAVVGAMLVGGLVRAMPFIGTDFPLNDGGLFLTMIEDLRSEGYALPISTSYNALDIPFAYPPLMFYVVGLLSDALGIPVVDLFRILPFLFSVAMIPAFYLISRQLVGPLETVFATVAFSLLPRTWEWLIQGGGITRAPGALLALLTIAAAIRMYRGPTPRGILVTGVGAGVTALTHPHAAVFLVVSLLVLLVSVERSWIGARSLAVAGLVAGALAAPWLILVLSRHGSEPFLSARGTGGGGLQGLILLMKLRFTGAPFMDILGVIGIAGVGIALAQRRWLFPAWLALILAVDSRGGATFAMVPLALLVGVALAAGAGALNLEASAATRPSSLIRQRPWVALSATALLLVAVLANQGVVAKDDSPVHAVSVEQREALSWSAEHLPPGSAVALVTGITAWERDRVSEWFTTLTGHQSVATVQGFEWLGAERRRAQLSRYTALQGCSRQTAECLSAWNADHAAAAEYVLIPKGPLSGPLAPDDCCPALRVTLRDLELVVYDGPGATISRMPDE
jgi:hypothetical protein